MTRYRTIVADPPWPIGDFPEWGGGKGNIATPYPTMSVEEIAALPVRELSNNVDADAHLYLWAIDGLLDEAFDVARAWGFHHAATIVWCKETMGTGLGGIWPANVEFCLFCRRPKVTTRPEVLAVTSRLADAADRAGITRADVDHHMRTSDMGGWWLSRLEHRCAIPTDEQWPKLRDLLRIGPELDDEVARLNALKGTAPPPSLTRAPGRWFQWPRGPHSAKPDAFLDLVEQVSPGPYLEIFARRARFGWDYAGDGSLGTVEIPGLRGPGEVAA